MDKKKQAWITKADTDVLQRISDLFRGRDEPTKDYPLGGVIHINELGHVPIKAIRKELARRQKGN